MLVYLSPSTQERNIGYGNYGSEEFRCNLICDVVEKELIRHYLEVTRNEPTMSLREVVESSNHLEADIHFAIHTNAFNKKARGCEIFCHRFGGEGHKLAKSVYKRIEKLTPTKDRGVKEGHSFYSGLPMYELAYTSMPASLIEIAFHDNPEDAKWIMENMEDIGIGIARGILDYFGIKYEQKEVTETLYRVMAGSYRFKDNAKNQVEKLKAKGFDACIMPFKVKK